MMTKLTVASVRRLVAALCVAVLMTLSLTGCGGVDSSSKSKETASGAVSAVTGQPQGPTITIGVATDLPGLGYWHDGAYSGFDIDVAVYVAQALGYSSRQIIFTQVEPQDRARVLDDGSTDMVVAGFAITDESMQQVTVAGPYLEVRPAVLVHQQDTKTDMLPDTLSSAEALDALRAHDMTLCAAQGTAVHTMIEHYQPSALRDYRTYGQCMTALMAGSVDAIAGDDVTLPELIRERRAQYRMVVDDDAADQMEYGIAVARGRDELAKKIASTLRTMVKDGSWQRYVDNNLEPLGYRPARTLSTDDIVVHSAS